MADLVPQGIDNSTGQTKPLTSSDNLVDSSGNLVFPPTETLGSIFQQGIAIPDIVLYSNIDGTGLLTNITSTLVSGGGGAGSASGANLWGSFFQHGTGTTSSGYVHLNTPSPGQFQPRHNLYLRYSGNWGTANIRAFCGFSNSASAQFTSDSPAAILVGLSYSTGNSDTNFQIISDSAGGSPTRIDTGVTATALFNFELFSSDLGVTWNWRLWAGGSQRVEGRSPDASGSFTADVPPAATAMALSIGVRSLEASTNKILNTYQVVVANGYYT
jgi:hypothetical protein